MDGLGRVFDEGKVRMIWKSKIYWRDSHDTIILCNIPPKKRRVINIRPAS